jgi:hypothetical protein
MSHPEHAAALPTGHAPVPAPLNVLAVLALVLGILRTGPAAIVLGYVAQSHAAPASGVVDWRRWVVRSAISS